MLLRLDGVLDNIGIFEQIFIESILTRVDIYSYMADIIKWSCDPIDFTPHSFHVPNN